MSGIPLGKLLFFYEKSEKISIIKKMLNFSQEERGRKSR